MVKQYKISEYARLNNVTTRTVWNWIKKGDVKTTKTNSGGWRIIEEEEDVNKRKNVAVYARVSSSENKTNLETQTQRLISYCNAKGYGVQKIVAEVGSGLNDKRPKLEKLLMDETINLIVVEHKDRLARFGTNYLEKLMRQLGREVEYVNVIQEETQDLMQDFISIITSFCARLYGQRRTKRMTEKLIRKIEEIGDKNIQA